MKKLIAKAVDTMMLGGVALLQALRSLRIAGRFARAWTLRERGSPCCRSRRQGDTMRREFTMSVVRCVLLLLPHL